MEFFRFPQTPHLLWLSAGTPREDKVMVEADAREFLVTEVFIEEKIDGANVRFSVDDEGEFQVQNRGTILRPESCHGQFKQLFRWLEPRRVALAEALFPDLMLFGEWCYAVHSVSYTNLPDWFLAFDVYDRAEGFFWSTARRDELAGRLDMRLVPKVTHGTFSLDEARGFLGPSRITDGPAEGTFRNEKYPGRVYAIEKDDPGKGPGGHGFRGKTPDQFRDRCGLEPGIGAGRRIEMLGA